eukprot:EG_transcript_4267
MQEEDWRRIGINAFGDLRIIQLATEELRDRRNQGGSEAWGLSRMYSSDVEAPLPQQSGDPLRGSRMVGGAARSLRHGTRAGAPRDDPWEKVAEECFLSNNATCAARPLCYDGGIGAASLSVLQEVGQIPRLGLLEQSMDHCQVSQRRREVIRAVWFAMADREVPFQPPLLVRV